MSRQHLKTILCLFSSTLEVYSRNESKQFDKTEPVTEGGLGNKEKK